MKLKKITYKIAVESFLSPGEETQVEGYAVDTIARICVRKVRGGWICDDYDTGYYMGTIEDTRALCIKKGIELLEKYIANGFYKKKQKAAFKRLKRMRIIK